MKKLLPLLLLLPLGTACLRADPPASSSVKFSRPESPQMVHIFVAQGRVNIRASDDKDTVTVTSETQPEKNRAPRPDGLRVISTGGSFALTESNNVVEINYSKDSFFSGASADFTVTVPRQASVRITEGWTTDISVEGMGGDIEVKNLNGEITLKDVSGGALVESMNGEIKASFTTVPTNKPLSFTSMNGKIELDVPAETKANVRFRTQNGSILTDFSEDILKTKSEPITAHSSSDASRMASDAARSTGDTAREATRLAKQVVREVNQAMRQSQPDARPSPAPGRPVPPPPPIPAMVGGKVVSGTLNGGGADIQIATMNGDIVVRKAAKP